MTELKLPDIATPDEWYAEIDKLRIEEKKLTRAHDTVNALRRRLPMVKIEKHYEFDSVEGNVNLMDLFCGRRQLIAYHFMFDPDWEVGCSGCSWVTDAMSHPAHLHARDTSLVLISRAPLQKLLAFREQMGWDFSWYSSFRSDFNFDFRATDDEGEHHVTSVFLRDGDDIYRTYFTDRRGVEYLGSHWTYLDLTPFGRQESWEDSPEGWPKKDNSATRRHNEYGD